MPQPIKITKVEQLNAVLKGATSIFMTDFSGLTVEQITTLRREFRKNQVDYVVVKNTLARLAAKQTGIEEIVQYLEGPTGLAVAKEDPLAPVRVIFDFRKKLEKPSIKGAFVEGQLLNQADAEELRTIPSREVLLGQVVSAVAAPLSGLIGGLNSLISQLAYAVNAIKEQKERTEQ
ncbi:MAG TPA: 50S ribosomal protein L10 [bacterium]|nr:50S ribosomal protein L10 [bacterium]HNT65327.1 50S ribosomal protein L10 [bacterium]HOX86495.1 50S ribosomal protein L10 [bacterium]HPG46521.1 50S ribosomal protein L10 [bacterium]HPM98423.1 50S ribosomal protein L10 [bacterium]